MKKVLIFSIEDDVSTNLVMDWICYKGQSAIRINNETIWGNDQTNFSVESLGSLATNVFFDNQSLNSIKDISSIYIRKGSSRRENNRDKQIKPEMFSDITLEASTAIDFLKIVFKNKIVLGRIETDINKLSQLEAAKMAGLNTPDTIMTNNKVSLLRLIEKHNKVITKSLNIIRPTNRKKSITIYYTSVVEKKMMHKIEETFAPGLFQEYIEKEFEIRTFYLKGKCYSMAIFSQRDSQTEIDYRDYNATTPNRTVPFALPKEEEKKLKTFMQKLNLNTGSIDLIKAKNGKYYFLEVNQSGQFGMVSNPCNYFLEEKIANLLTNIA